MNKDLKDALLEIMDLKHHWGWKFLSSDGLKKHQLLTHFQQEYETYIRDFPIFLARILGRMENTQSPADDQLKREIAENLYEEQTGGISQKLSQGRSHPELFLKMMSGLGFSKKQFEKIDLLPTSLAYRCFLDRVTLIDDWRMGAAILSIFVEGSCKDRERLKRSFKEKDSLKKKLSEHALIKHYGLKEKDADLIKVHHAVEGDHRRSAWETILRTVPDSQSAHLVQRMTQALELWLLFRDGVCVEMGLESEEFRALVEASA